MPDATRPSSPRRATPPACSTWAESLAAIVTAWEDGAEATIRPAEPGPDVEPHKMVDPVALAALIVSLPSALLAVADLADRIRKRRRAADLIEAATRLHEQGHARIWVVRSDVPVDLSGSSADNLIRLAEEHERS